MIPVLLAFLSSSLWGVSDFLGGVAARGSIVLRTTTWAYFGAAVTMVLVAFALPGSWSSAVIMAGTAAAVTSLAGFLAFYAALASAPMGPIGAIVGATQAIVPVIVAVVWRGESISVLAWVGIAIAVIGSVLIGVAEGGNGGRATLRPIVLAVLAGVFFGGAVVSLGLAPKDAGVLAPTIEVSVGLALVLLLVLATRALPGLDGMLHVVGITSGERRPAKRTDIVAILSGVVLAGANIVMIFALQAGSLAAVGVVISLYPVTTAVLARVFLKERLTPMHIIGILGALGGCALLAAP